MRIISFGRVTQRVNFCEGRAGAAGSGLAAGAAGAAAAAAAGAGAMAGAAYYEGQNTLRGAGNSASNWIV